MAKPRKVHEAIALVFAELGPEPKLPSEILTAIEERNLYPFLTEDKIGVVRRELRRHSVGLEFKSASFHKRYEQDANGRFSLLATPQKARLAEKDKPRSKRDELLALRDQHVEEIRSTISASLKKMDPYAFEQFAKRLVEAYGFRNVEVTKRSADGGIDGHGRIHFGMAQLNAAFQCKRYTNTPVGLPQIHEFRGAISGQFQQGIFFTTSKFTKQALAASLRPGAVPIALMDGMKIAQLMIEKGLAVEKEAVELYSYTPDALFDESEKRR